MTDYENINELDPFDRVIAEIDRLEPDAMRHLSIQIDADVRAMLVAAHQTGQTASVTVKLTAKRKGEQIELTGASTSKLPKPVAATVRLYTDETGELFDHNPLHALSSLPGVDVKTPKAKRKSDPKFERAHVELERPINARKE